MKVKDYYLGSPSAETQRLMTEWQREADHYGDMSPEQIEEELNNDPGYQEFLDDLDKVPF